MGQLRGNRERTSPGNCGEFWWEPFGSPSVAFVPQWEFHSPNGQGLRAPVGTVLEVKGAWMDATGALTLPDCAA